jgi:hypothetical protein
LSYGAACTYNRYFHNSLFLLSIHFLGCKNSVFDEKIPKRINFFCKFVDNLNGTLLFKL